MAESFPSSDPPANGAPGSRESDAAPAPGAASSGARVAVEIETGSSVTVTLGDEEFELDHGHVVIAAITSCTNTSNPSVMLGAGILARNAAQRGLTSKPWVKTSLAPGSKVVTEYLDRAGLTEPLEALGFHLVGYGCTTCIGNSGPLPDEISAAVTTKATWRSARCSRATATSRAHQPGREDTPSCSTMISLTFSSMGFQVVGHKIWFVA